MLLSTPEFVLIVLAFFVIAALYSSVGFGGGSSYLAILALVLSSFFMIRSTALLCNLVVVSGSCYLFFKKGHMDIKKFTPFIITSIPLAFVGASFRLEEHIFFIILGVALIVSSIALMLQSIHSSNQRKKFVYPPFVPYLLGGAIGLLSGLVGIGGGIFLAPVLNHMRWDTSVKIAALASFFILVNSVSGISGLLVNGTFEIPWELAAGLVLAVFLGGQLGVRLSLSRLKGKGIKLITAFLVFIVGLRVLIINGMEF